MGLITISEAADQLGLKQNDTLYKLNKQGKLNIIYESDKVRLVEQAEIDKIKEEKYLNKIPAGMRKCTKCGFLGEFFLFAYGRNRCLPCHEKIEKDRREKHWDRNREVKLAYCDKNRDRENERAKNWYQNNKERVKLTQILKKYGLTKGEYDKMLKRNNYCCEICGTKLTKPCIDHNHQKTGKESVRGILCTNCNTAIGYCREDIKTLENMISYLKKYNGV